jgi:aspartate kinase
MTLYFNDFNRDFEYGYKVIKLGGTSQCKIGYDRLIQHIKRDLDKKYFIVLSAISGVTNNLVKFIETKNNTYIDSVLQLNYKLIGELNLDINQFKLVVDKFQEICKDYITSYDINDTYKKSEIIGYGEVLSTNIFYSYIDSDSELKIRSIKLYNSYDHIKSKKEIYQCDSSAEFYFEFDNTHLAINDINIFQGFIGSTPSGKKVLLGRGGSDTTGSLIAARLNAISYEVWTDVNGIYTADPNITKNVKLINTIDYELVQELAAMGAKVMHPLSIQPCAEKNIPIIVKNTFNLESLWGELNTCITTNNNLEEINKDIFVATQKSQAVFNIKSPNMWNAYGFVYDIFRCFSDKQVDVNIITTSQFSVSTTTSDTNIYKLYSLRDNLREKYDVELYESCVILSVITNDIKRILNLINYEFLKNDLLMIHVGNNNKTLNLVLKKFNIEYIDIIYSMFNVNL